MVDDGGQPDGMKVAPKGSAGSPQPNGCDLLAFGTPPTTTAVVPPEGRGRTHKRSREGASCDRRDGRTRTDTQGRRWAQSTPIDPP